MPNYSFLIFTAAIGIAVVSGCKTAERNTELVEGALPETSLARTKLPVFVLPVHVGGDENAIYTRTAQLIDALRAAGFNAYAADPKLNDQNDKPHLVIATTAMESEYCLQGVVWGEHLPQMEKISFEHRQAPLEGMIKLSDYQCAKFFAEKLRKKLR